MFIINNRNKHDANVSMKTVKTKWVLPIAMFIGAHFGRKRCVLPDLIRMLTALLTGQSLMRHAFTMHRFYLFLFVHPRCCSLRNIVIVARGNFALLLLRLQAGVISTGDNVDESQKLTNDKASQYLWRPWNNKHTAALPVS
jgi:hypothetical protein